MSTRVELVAVTAEDADMRLDRWVKRRCPGLTQGRLEKLLRGGQIRVDGKKVKSSHRIAEGEQVRLPPMISTDAEAVGGPAAPRSPIRAADPHAVAALQRAIVYEDDHLLAINKEAGLAVQGGSGVRAHVDGLLAAIYGSGEAAPKLVHRLDKDTSGVLLLAKTAQAARACTAAFRSRETQKVYWALVVGTPPGLAGRISAPLAKLPGARGEQMAVDYRQGKPAVTDWRVIDKAAGRFAWLELRPLTGRTHQLRVHCLEMGIPILGDGKYGGADAHDDATELAAQLHLHARALSLSLPKSVQGGGGWKGGVAQFEAPPSPTFVKSLKYLGFALGDAPDPFEPWSAE